MQAVQSDGAQLRDHLESLERQTGASPPGLAGPDCPPSLAHVWIWYCELAAVRGSTGFGPARIDYAGIEAWSRLTGACPTPFEVDCLIALDRVYFEHLSEANK